MLTEQQKSNIAEDLRLLMLRSVPHIKDKERHQVRRLFGYHKVTGPWQHRCAMWKRAYGKPQWQIITPEGMEHLQNLYHRAFGHDYDTRHLKTMETDDAET